MAEKEADMFKVPQNTRQQESGLERVKALTDGDKADVLDFLSQRPLDTFIQASWIHDNGLVSRFNRGTFYGYRGDAGQLDGVALIGHINLFETQNESALAAFAQLTKDCSSARVVLSEETKATRFMVHYQKQAPSPRLVCRELLLEKHRTENANSVSTLRPAGSEDLHLVVPIHAELAVEESGVNPLDVDPKGFVERCARRIQQGRVWVAIEDGRLKFKADIVSQTADVTYLEGIYVSGEHRGNGYGGRCLTQLTNHLLERTKSVCLLVNQNNQPALKSYTKAGYKFREYYDTFYLQQ